MFASPYRSPSQNVLRSSMLIQQCQTCLVHFTLIVCEMGAKWTCISYFVTFFRIYLKQHVAFHIFLPLPLFLSLPLSLLPPLSLSLNHMNISSISSPSPSLNQLYCALSKHFIFRNDLHILLPMNNL